MKRLFIGIVLGAVLIGLLLNVPHPAVDDAKLQLTRVWSFFTLKNNPLLPSLDKDLQFAGNGENVPPNRIALSELLGGGPPKDGIPSLDNPQFTTISETEFSDEELIIGVVIDGEAKAYPYAILNWHEIVNDTLARVPIAVTYCPLCETNSVFRRVLEIAGEERTVSFGVSGKLFQSCLVMYDRLTDSMYAQVWGLGVVGSETNTVLERLPAVRTTIGAWKERYPDSEVLTTETGHRRDYSRYPYGTYYTNNQLIFPVRNLDKMQEHPKEITQIIFNHDEENIVHNEFSGTYHAFTQAEVREAGEITFDYQASSQPLTYKATWDETLATIRFTDEVENEVPSMALFNFVLPAYFEAVGE